MSVSERQIVWVKGGLEERVRRLETRLAKGDPSARTGGGTGLSPGVPGKPSGLEVIDQIVVQDHLGQTLVAVTLSWEGEAELWEIAWGEAV